MTATLFVFCDVCFSFSVRRIRDIPNYNKGCSLLQILFHYMQIVFSEAATGGVRKKFRKIWEVFLEISQNSSENTCARVSFLIKLQASEQIFYCECCEISKNTFFKEQLRATASIFLSSIYNQYLHTARNSTAFQCLDFNVAKWSSSVVNETLVGNVCKLLPNL